MTWNHRRAKSPLLATGALFAGRRPDVRITWDSRPLSGFDSISVEALARSFDLIVCSYTFCGAIAAANCFVPLDDIVAPLRDKFAGPSLVSYMYAEGTWAVPIDASAQVQAVRPDLLATLEEDAPKAWPDVARLGRKARRHGLFLGIALRGIGALTAFYTLTASMGQPCATTPDDDFCDARAARVALSMMRELLGYCPPQSLDWSAIQLLRAMVARDDVVASPMVDCYATYAEIDRRPQLRFHDLPGPGGSKGAALGGAGLGVSAKSRHLEAALDYARFAAEARTQFTFSRHHGQPARNEVWDDHGVNSAFGESFNRIRGTLDGAWIKPRYAGFIKFQEEAGSLIEAHLRNGSSADMLIDRLRRIHILQRER